LPLLKCGFLLSFIGGAFATGGVGKGRIKTRRYFATAGRVSLIAAGATEQTRNREPTADRMRWFDQRASAELSALLSNLIAPRLILARGDGI
jgi:hypothetical protein